MFYVHDIITDEMVPFGSLAEALEYAYRIGAIVPADHVYRRDGERFVAI